MGEGWEEGACDVPFRIDGDVDDLGLEMVDYPLYVFFVFAGVEGAGGVNEYATRFEARPYIMYDGALELLTLDDIVNGPLADGFGVFAEHALA